MDNTHTSNMITTCRTCGAKFPITEKQCPYCGNYVAQTEEEQDGVFPEYLDEKAERINQTDVPTENEGDSASGGLNVLSVFFPIVGWILCAALKPKFPRKAKFCKIWAWIGFGIWTVFSLYIWVSVHLF